MISESPSPPAKRGLSHHSGMANRAPRFVFVFLVLLSSLQASWAIGEYSTLPPRDAANRFGMQECVYRTVAGDEC